jgi:hypothetical protein
MIYTSQLSAAIFLLIAVIYMAVIKPRHALQQRLTPSAATIDK